jgi:hypothetical protein
VTRTQLRFSKLCPPFPCLSTSRAGPLCYVATTLGPRRRSTFWGQLSGTLWESQIHKPQYRYKQPHTIKYWSSRSGLLSRLYISPWLTSACTQTQFFQLRVRQKFGLLSRSNKWFVNRLNPGTSRTPKSHATETTSPRPVECVLYVLKGPIPQLSFRTLQPVLNPVIPSTLPTNWDNAGSSGRSFITRYSRHF